MPSQLDSRLGLENVENFTCYIDRLFCWGFGSGNKSKLKVIIEVETNLKDSRFVMKDLANASLLIDAQI